MTIDQVINILVTITLFEMMITIGLGVTFSQIADVARDRGLVARAAIANYVLVPGAAVALLLLYHAHPLVAAGFLIAAVCPGAPYGPPFTAMAKGNVPQSVGLMVTLAASSAIVAPLLLKFLLPWMAGNQPLHVNVGKMVFTLILSQLLPLSIGLFFRQSRPALAEKLKNPGSKLSTVLNLVVFGLIIAVQYKTLAAIRPLGFLGMFVLAIAALAAGWLLGWPGTSARKAMGLTTGVRNVGVSLVIATGSFPGTPAISAALAYAVFQTIVLALIALAWGRMSPEKATVPGVATT